MTRIRWESLEFMPFREFVRDHAQQSHFRSEYLSDARKPNHTSWKELEAYLMSSPRAGDLSDAKRAWDTYCHIPAVQVESHRSWSLAKI